MTPETTEKTSAWKDVLWASFAVAIGSMLWIAYRSDVWDEATRVQSQIRAQHDEFVIRRHLWDKSQEITAAQSRADVEPSIREIQGLQDHVHAHRGRPKRQKK